MATILPNRHRLDITGINANNLVIGELHTPAVRKIRSVATTYGPYFTDSLRVFDHVTNKALVRGIDYQCVDILSLPTAQYAKEICTIILLTNRLISIIRIDYQALGGEYERQYEAIKLLLENLLVDDRPIDWMNVIKPDGFNPSLHLHAIGDVIGFEYVVVALEQLRNVIMLGDESTHIELFRKIEDNRKILLRLMNDNLVEITNNLTTEVNGINDIINTLDSKCDDIFYKASLMLAASEHECLIPVCLTLPD